MVAHYAIVYLGDALYSQIGIPCEAGDPVADIFIIKTPDSLCPQLFVLTAEQDLCVTQPVQDIDSRRLIELGGS